MVILASQNFTWHKLCTASPVLKFSVSEFSRQSAKKKEPAYVTNLYEPELNGTKLAILINIPQHIVV